MHKEELDIMRHMGLMTSHSCANYLIMSYYPSVGQHCSWFESSQIPYVNATLGARANFDGTFATASWARPRTMACTSRKTATAPFR
jgi:predicted aconitase